VSHVYERCTEAAVEQRIRYVQLRMKGEPHEDVLRMAIRLRRITAGTETRFIVNDEVHVAAGAGTDGVHLGQNDLPLAEARRRLGTDRKSYRLRSTTRRRPGGRQRLRPTTSA
jgi:thiamine-phosphate pyrophosphorylase